MLARDYRQGGNLHVALDFSKPPQPRHRAVAALAVADLPPGGRLLDGGCGRGEIAALVRGLRPDARISIADAYPACLDGTRRRVGEIESAHLIDEERFDIAEVVQGPFDVIVLCHVLEHLRRPVDAARDLLGLLGPEGVLVAAAPNLGTPGWALRSVFGMDLVNEGHVCGWNRAHWRNFWGNVVGARRVRDGADVADLLPGRLGAALRRTIGRPLVRLAPTLSDSLISVIRPMPTE